MPSERISVLKRSAAVPPSHSTAAAAAGSRAVLHPLHPASVLALQRTSGNQMTQRVIQALRAPAPAVVQRSHTDNADDFIAWIPGQPAYADYTGGVEGQCSDAIRTIGALLNDQHIPFVYRAILLFHRPEGKRSNYNKNHFVVVATVDGQQLVVDPTQGQFQNGAAMVARAGEWAAAFQNIQARLLVSWEQGNDEKQWFSPPMKFSDFASDDWDGAAAYGGESNIAFDAIGGTVLRPPEEAEEAEGHRGTSCCTIL